MLGHQWPTTVGGRRGNSLQTNWGRHSPHISLSPGTPVRDIHRPSQRFVQLVSHSNFQLDSALTCLPLVETCRTWESRAVVLHCGHPRGGNLERTNGFLERYKSSPLTVDIRYYDVADTTRAVFQERHRIQDLKVKIFCMSYEDHGFPDTAPVLRSLALYDNQADYSTGVLPNDVPSLFNTCQYPALTDLDIYYLTICPSSTLWAGTLTRLSLRECGVSPEELFAILERTPLLQELMLGNTDESDPEPTPHTSSSIELLQLKLLTLYMIGDISKPTQVLNRIRIPASCHLDISVLEGPPVSVHEAREFWSSRAFSECWIGTMKEFRSCFIYSESDEVMLAFECDLRERMIARDTRFQVTISSYTTEPIDFFQEFFLRYSAANVESLSVDNSCNWYYHHRDPAYWGLVLSALPNLKKLKLIEDPGVSTPVFEDVLYCLDPLRGGDVKVTVPGGDPPTTFIAQHLDNLVLEGGLSTERRDRNQDLKGEVKTLIEVLNHRKEYGIPVGCLHLKRSGVIDEELEELRSIVPDVQINSAN